MIREKSRKQVCVYVCMHSQGRSTNYAFNARDIDIYSFRKVSDIQLENELYK